jgi:hypothetical protein
MKTSVGGARRWYGTNLGGHTISRKTLLRPGTGCDSLPRHVSADYAALHNFSLEVFQGFS